MGQFYKLDAKTPAGLSGIATPQVSGLPVSFLSIYAPNLGNVRSIRSTAKRTRLKQAAGSAHYGGIFRAKKTSHRDH